MKNLMLALVASIVLPASASAATPVEQVGKIDAAREGNLRVLVSNFFRTNLRAACEQGQLPRIDTMKISSNSANEEKVPGTMYTYEADYLVVQTCMSGSTFQGAYLDVVKSSIVRGSFRSKYNAAFGPAKMVDLKIKLIREADLSVTQN